MPVHYPLRQLRVTQTPAENVHPLYSPRLQHGRLVQQDIIRVFGQVKMLKDLLNPFQQLYGLWYLSPAVLTYMLLCGIGWTDVAELIGFLEPFEVFLVHHREGSREELTESAEKWMMFRRALLGKAPLTVEQIQFYNDF